jgi:nicotinamidase-related amidase
MPKAQATPGKTLLSPTDHTLIMIDHQSQMSFATKSIDAVLLRNNCALVAKAAREFKVSTILTTVAEKSFSGPIYEEIRSVFPKDEIIDRTTMNAWEDARLAKRVERVLERGHRPRPGLHHTTLPTLLRFNGGYVDTVGYLSLQGLFTHS